MVDAEEDPRFAGALDDAPERGDLLWLRCREPGLPEARDPDRPEAGILELLECRPGVADPVVDRADEEGLVLVAAAAAERQRGEAERTENSVLPRTTTGPGRVACTNVIESL